MTTQLPGQTFRQLLRAELTKRTESNSGYSLRAFARAIDVSPSSLSMVMGAKCPVTMGFIEKVGHRLKLGSKEIMNQQMSLLKEKVNLEQEREFENIDQDRFQIIKDWYHYAILNLMRTKDFKAKPHWIAKRLGISLGQAQSAIENLKAAQFLEIKDGQWIDKSSGFTTHLNNKKYSEAAKQNQQQLFHLAAAAIENVDFQVRNHTGSTIAVAKEELDEIKDFITLFRKEFIQRFDKSKDADEVYHLSVGLFPLTKSQFKGEPQ
mgnify:CR=1 FL=1